MADIYDSYVQLGQAFKAKSPALNSMSDEDVGKLAAKKYPARFTVVPAPTPTAPGILGAFNGAVDTAIGAKSPFGHLVRGFNSGATLGGSEAAQRLLGNALGEPQDDPSQSIMFQAGTMVGEIAMPYRLLSQMFAPVLELGLARQFPQLARTVATAISGGAVEGSKAVMQEKDDPLSHLAAGLALAGGAEAVTRGTALAGVKIAERIIHPKPGEVDWNLIQTLQAKGLPALPADVLPTSGVAAEAERRTANSQSTRALLIAVHGKLVAGMTKLREEALLYLGENAATLSPTEIGENLKNSLASTANQLQQQGSQNYKDLLATKIGEVPINPRQLFVRKLQDGTTYETSMLGGFKDILGPDILGNPTSAAHSPAKKRLYRVYAELEKAHHSIPQTKVVEVTAPQFIQRLAPDPSVSETVMGRRVELPAGGFFTTNLPPSIQTQNIFPEHNYQWWWNRLQSIGGMLNERLVKENPKDYKLISRAYHLLQDGMDVQAGAKNPDYDTAVRHARASWELYNNYDNHSLVKAIINKADKNPEAAIDVAFANTHTLREAKKILGPQVFNSLRQGWIRDLTWDASTRDSATNISYVSGSKVFNKMKKFTDGIDSEYMKEMFSDNGFTAPDGTPLQANTNAAEKYSKFKELINLALKLDRGIAVTHTGTGDLSTQMIERIPYAPLLKDLATGGQRTRGLLANLLLLRKGGELYFAPPGENIFLGVPLPKIQEGAIPIPFSKRNIPGAVRSGTTAAALIRLFGPTLAPDEYSPTP